ncbi:DUF6463 family protein [Blastococcus xanthinilyticus]|uniref:DUF4345 domain-containing protein n=1 Tax=Blastococcus xanthinilyticus TaxID=1564164 RepID=A0A5S5CZV1_9ACTN|nr:DUF6463 family protein [Blastococcus xanthinilyticus]TYP89045.1 hypothetical protein BD833_103201 [Blastococcus xanthinilyticus]
MSTAPGGVPPVRSAGLWTVVLGVAHVASVHAFYPESVRSVVDGGVIASVDADPVLTERRGVGFWYVTSGLGVIGLGAIVRGHEKVHGRPPPATATVLVATGLWGVLLMPASPFWLFLPIAWLARRSANIGGRSGHH